MSSSAAEGTASQPVHPVEAADDVKVREGFHSFVVSGTKFEIEKKYKFIKPVGHGAYGVVMYVTSIYYLNPSLT